MKIYTSCNGRINPSSGLCTRCGRRASDSSNICKWTVPLETPVHYSTKPLIEFYEWYIEANAANRQQVIEKLQSIIDKYKQP